VILADSSVLIAAANANEPEHKACAALVRENPAALLVSPLVVAEVCYLLDKRLGVEPEAAFLDSLARGSLVLTQLAAADLPRMSTLVRRYAPLHLGASDASIVALAERLNITEVATLDRRHFSVVRPAHCDAFRILPD
jgi:uncharacterized protein